MSQMVIGRGRAKKENIISFIAKNQRSYEIFDAPIPAGKILPEWYKRENSSMVPGQIVMSDDGNPQRTIKACMPIFDMMTAGYIITLPGDLIIQHVPGEIFPKASWSTDEMELITNHIPEQFRTLSTPEEYHRLGYKFMNPWTIKTPPGYSCFFTQPAMRDDLPFQVLPAIVDTDRHPVSVNFPFFLRKDFEGILEMGTPIMQVIPFKRDEWSSEVSYSTDDSSEVEWQKSKRKLMNRYKTFYRTPKIWK
jgi:hypothetical protein